MAQETLSFDIFAHDVNASKNIKQVGNAALETSGKLDIAAASMKLFGDTSVKSAKADTTLVSSMKTHTKAAALLADAEGVLAGRSTTTTKLLSEQRSEVDRNTGSLARLIGGAGGGGLAGLGAAIPGLGGLLSTPYSAAAALAAALAALPFAAAAAGDRYRAGGKSTALGSSRVRKQKVPSRSA